MAEGDTILRTALRIAEALEGEALDIGTPGPRGRASGVGRLDGRVLTGVEARGKNLLLYFDGLVLHSHLGMSGSWHVYRRGERWRKPSRLAWAVLRGERNEAVQWGGPTLRVLRSEQLHRDPKLCSLGPDILSADFSPDAAIEGMRRADPEWRLGEALLDQRLLAGVGNIFKSEGCHAAGVDPWLRLGDLSDADVEAVITETRELMMESVSTGRRTGEVYRRAGEPCHRCGSEVLSGGQGDSNRTTYWCPGCQRN
jgi:endonuclease-8